MCVSIRCGKAYFYLYKKRLVLETRNEYNCKYIEGVLHGYLLSTFMEAKNVCNVKFTNCCYYEIFRQQDGKLALHILEVDEVEQ